MSPPRAAARRSRGVSLIEALVALAVMAMGMIGVLGLQASLRANADISKQRSEAVRLAQAAMEDLRAFSLTRGAAVATEHEYTDITTTAAATVATGTTNATYSRSVTSAAPAASAPRMRTAAVRVSWFDRTSDSAVPSQAQSVELVSLIAESSPELAVALSVPAAQTALSRPLGRHAAIPRNAVIVPSSPNLSSFSPPGGGTTTWSFDNATGTIFRINGAEGRWGFLSGTIRFATGDSQPGEADAEVPVGPVGTGAELLASNLRVRVVLSVPATVPSAVTPASPVNCFTAAGGSPTEVQYACAIQLWPESGTQLWSGRIEFTVRNGTPNPLASSTSDAGSSLFKICRYTPEDTDTPSGGNRDNPLNFARVTVPLNRKDFLVIRAGNGSAAYVCPTDATPLPLNANTRAHQPR